MYQKYVKYMKWKDIINIFKEINNNSLNIFLGIILNDNIYF
jgi:hypothetical protein